MSFDSPTDDGVKHRVSRISQKHRLEDTTSRFSQSIERGEQHTLSSYPKMISRALPNLSFTHNSVMVAPKDTNLAVTEPSGAEMVVISKGCSPKGIRLEFRQYGNQKEVEIGDAHNLLRAQQSTESKHQPRQRTQHATSGYAEFDLEMEMPWIAKGLQNFFISIVGSLLELEMHCGFSGWLIVALARATQAFSASFVSNRNAGSVVRIVI